MSRLFYVRLFMAVGLSGNNISACSLRNMYRFNTNCTHTYPNLSRIKRQTPISTFDPRLFPLLHLFTIYVARFHPSSQTFFQHVFPNSHLSLLIWLFFVLILLLITSKDKPVAHMCSGLYWIQPSQKDLDNSSVVFTGQNNIFISLATECFCQEWHPI